MFIAACIFPLLSTQYEEILDSEISGIYRSGFVHASRTMNLTADRKYVINSSSCLTRSKETGTWIRQGNEIVLTKLDSSDKKYIDSNERIVPIRFNHHLYMIEPNSVPAFAEQARKGKQATPPFSDFPIKMNEKDPWNEFVESNHGNWVPIEFRPYFEFGPIGATVVRIMKNQRVEVDLIAKFPVLPLTRLGIKGPISIELQIESVTGATAMAKVWYVADSGRSIRVGDIFSSTGHVYPESKRRFAEPY